MQSSYDRSLAAVLEHEGGYSDHPADNGGATNKGITIANFRRYVKADGTKADLKRLTTEQAAVVYRHQYWAAVSADVLPPGVDYAVFDFGVNSGPGRAIKFLQRVVGVKQDGRIGPKTLAAVKAMPLVSIIRDLCEARLLWLATLDDWPTFKRGWTSRVSGVRKLALDLAGEAVVDEIIQKGVEEAVAEDTITVTTPTGPPTVTIPAPPANSNRLFLVIGSIIAAIFAAIVNFAQGGANG